MFTCTAAYEATKKYPDLGVGLANQVETLWKMGFIGEQDMRHHDKCPLKYLSYVGQEHYKYTFDNIDKINIKNINWSALSRNTDSKIILANIDKPWNMFNCAQNTSFSFSLPKSPCADFTASKKILSIPIEDKMHTFTEHIAMQTALALTNQQGKMLVTGGGAYNDFLIGRLQFHLAKLELIIPDRKTLEYKEALIFALLGVLKLRNEINVLSSVTGAKMDHSSGIIY
jgi:hypothetical protein